MVLTTTVVSLNPKGWTIMLEGRGCEPVCGSSYEKSMTLILKGEPACTFSSMLRPSSGMPKPFKYAIQGEMPVKKDVLPLSS